MRIRAAAIIIPALLLAALVALDYVVVQRLLPPGQSHLVLYVIGLAGVIAFSVVILDRLSRLAARERAQARRVAGLAEDLQAKRVQLQALNAAGISLSAELSTDHVLEKIADLARVVAGARYAALGIFDGNGTVTDFITSGITPEQRAAIGPLPKGRGILGLLPREGRPIRLRDLADHTASVGFPANHPPMRSFLGVPILWRGASVGNLYLTEKLEGVEFSADDEEALLTLAAQAAIAIENARLYAQAENVSVLEERHRIGMDLHDGAIQSLYGLGLLIEGAAEGIESEPTMTREALGRAVDRLNATIADLRSYVLGLRPIRGSDRPLHESLPTLAEQVGANALLDMRVDIDPESEALLDRTRSEAVFYVASDALGNVARHARARHASVRLFRGDDSVLLEIVDDGVGFDPARPGEGFGLRNMRARAFTVGGRLDVVAAPAEGTQVRLYLPIGQEALR